MCEEGSLYLNYIKIDHGIYYTYDRSVELIAGISDQPFVAVEPKKSFTLSRVFQSSCFATRLIVGRSRSVFKPRFTRFMIIPHESFKAIELETNDFSFNSDAKYTPPVKIVT